MTVQNLMLKKGGMGLISPFSAYFNRERDQAYMNAIRAESMNVTRLQ